MKRPLQLSLAIALVLGGTNAFALGLGPVHVMSKLNQPLDAEIPVIQGTQGEAEGLLVNLATAEDFERIGLNRSRLNVPLEFAVVKGANGQLVIKVTSKEIVRDSYLDFLLEANWPKGRLLREYTVLLDPPLTAPARSTAAAPAAAPRATTQALRGETRTEKTTTTVAATPSPRPERHHAPAPAAAPARKTSAGEYGPVEAGETLSGIAREARPDERVNLNQMMLALYRSNPDAFYRNNINALKRGAILRVSSADEIKAVGSASEAAAQVHAQIEDWRGGRATPTLVAEAAPKPSASSPSAAKPSTARAPAAPAPEAATAKSGGERLELVPPKAGRGTVAMADRPGSGAGNAAATTELKSELARTKEALTTRDQEAGELKSRVKELEGLKSKNDRLLGLKDSEIAELQQKLKQLQEQSRAPAKPAASSTTLVTPAPAPAATTSTTPSAATPGAAVALKPAAGAKIDKQDIWGNTGSVATPSSAKPAGATPAGTPAASTATPSSSAGTALSSATPSTTPAGTVASTQAPAATPSATAPVPTNTSGGAVVTPLAPTPATTSGTPPASPMAKPAVSANAPKTMAKPQVARPWYDAGWVKPAALAAGVLLLLLGLLGLRKRKVEPARGSLADAFGDSPMASGGSPLMSAEDEAEKLRDQLHEEPGNVGLHLELLGLYYAERDVPNFEREAEAMHEHVTDAHQPEWLEAQAMGQELAPHNPLFAGGAHYDEADAAIASAHADTVERPTAHTHEYEEFTDFGAEPGAAAPAHEDFAFDIPPTQATYAEPGMPVPLPPPASSGLAEDFDFDHLPPLEPRAHTAGEAAPAGAAHVDEEFYSGEDAIGTKLDLARAYLDMGDPEGARSMLEEVVAEGSDAQKAEARRLIEDIH